MGPQGPAGQQGSAGPQGPIGPQGPRGPTGGVEEYDNGHPVYLWLTDADGNDIPGSVDIAGRVGSIEIDAFGHSIDVPFDPVTHQITGQRKHSAVKFIKPVDRSTPYLFKAVCESQLLGSAEFRWYQMSESGTEVEFYNVKLEGVKIVRVAPHQSSTLDNDFEKEPELEEVYMVYQHITWTFINGGLQASDTWSGR